MTLDLDHLRSWIGREETADDTVTLMPVRALLATLDREEPATLEGDALPPVCTEN